MGLHDQERVRFKVVSWADCTKTGKIVDVQGIAYDVGIKSLSPDADGVLFPGEEVEGYLADWDQVLDIAGTAANFPERNRAAAFKEFEARLFTPSADQGKPRRSRLPPDAPDPDGRFSHPKD